MSNNGILQAKNTKYLPANTTTYNITQDDDFIFVDTSLNAVTLVLPNIRNGLLVENPKCFKINDYSGNAATNNITIQGCGGDSVNSGVSFTMSSNYESVETNVVNQDEWFLSSSVGNTPVSGFVPYTGATQSVDLGNYGLTTYNLVVGQQQGGYVTGGQHKAQIVADNSIQTPLTVIGGSGAIEFWKDNTPTKAVSFGMAVAGSPVTDNFILSTFDGATWTQRMSVANSNGDLTIGTSSAFYGGYYNITGTAGAGYMAYISQSTTPATPATGFNLYGGSSNTVNWISPNGFITRLDSTANTNDRTYTFPDASGTIALTSSLSGYVPYTGATTNVDLGIYGLSGDGQFNFGNAVTTNQRLVRIGQDTAYVDIGSLVGTTSSAALYLNQATPSGTNYILMADSSGNYYINGGMNGGNLSVRLNNNNIMSANTTAITWTPLAVSAGSPIPFQIQLPNSTGQTASTNSPAFKVTGNTKQWLAGALATQYFNYFSANTVAFASASTATNVYGLYVEAATAGTNATITNNYALGTNGNVIFDDGTSKMIWRAVPTVPSYSGIFLNETPSSTNPSMYGDGSGNTFVNGSASVYIARGTSNVARFGFHFALFTAQNNGAGSTIPFDIAPVSATNTTASTEVNTLRVGNSFTRTWATGAITTQRFIYFPTQTIAFGSASTVTTAYGLYVEAATAGTNATITNNYSAGFSGGNGLQVQTGSIANQGIVIRDLTSASTFGAIYMGVTPSSTNYIIASSGATGSDLNLNAPSSTSQIVLRINNTQQYTFAPSSITFSPSNPTTGSSTIFNFIKPAETGLTASTEVIGYAINNTNGKTWATGNITTQRDVIITPTTYNFASPSTVTNAYSFYVSSPIAGANATITNNYAAGFGGATTATSFVNSEVGYKIIGAFVLDYTSTTLRLGTSSYFQNIQLMTNGVSRITLSTTDATIFDGYNFIIGSTTGTKIGTATTEKIGFWNATPIVQPTTAVAAATFVANTSGIVNDTATFDGYTIGQVVKALRNAGLLA